MPSIRLFAAVIGGSLVLSSWDVAPRHATGGDAAAVLDTAIARMGGDSALRSVERVRMDMITQWQRTSFDERPYSDAPSFELHTELRDYTIAAWRNSRRFNLMSPTPQIVDVVRDSVAIRQSAAALPAGPGSPATAAGAWSPLNVAYVDERRELFAFAPERLLLAARAAVDLRALADTTIGGVRHARVAATIDRFPSTLFVRRADGFLVMARYRAAHPNDYGLTPWGEMEVELWYSQWGKAPSGIVYPRQFDVRRVGRPYKRMSVLTLAINSPTVVADSFAVPDSLRGAFFRVANRAMHDIPLDSAKRLSDRVVAFNTFAGPLGAVKLGSRWVLIEGGQAPLNAERAVAWLGANGGGSVAAAIFTMTTTGNGGASILAARGVPLHVASGSEAIVGTILRNRGVAARVVLPVTAGRWLRIDGDSLWLEPIDLPNARGSLIVWSPSLRWVYSQWAAAPLERDLILERARVRGWPVEFLGSARGIWTPAPSGLAKR